MTDTGHTPKTIREVKFEIKVDTSRLSEALANVDEDQLRKAAKVVTDDINQRLWRSLDPALLPMPASSFPFLPLSEILNYDPAAERERFIQRLAAAYQVPSSYFVTDVVTAVMGTSDTLDKFGLDLNFEYYQRRRQRRVIVVLIVVMVLLTLVVALGGAA